MSIENRILMTLEYLREYRTYAHIGASYGISETRAFENIRFIEDELVKSKVFRLPGKKALLKSDNEFEVILIDATESPIERPKKQRKFYSGKNKSHTIKTQVVVNKETELIVCTNFSEGKKHDFHLYKNSKVYMKKETKALTSTEYLGLKLLHSNTEIPKKKSLNKPLTDLDKLKNRELSSQRASNEHVMGIIKHFRIITDKYRNRRKHFGLRFNFIAGIYNFEL